jgi:hypothetical protein
MARASAMPMPASARAPQPARRARRCAGCCFAVADHQRRRPRGGANATTVPAAGAGSAPRADAGTTAPGSCGRLFAKESIWVPLQEKGPGKGIAAALVDRDREGRRADRIRQRSGKRGARRRGGGDEQPDRRGRRLRHRGLAQQQNRVAGDLRPPMQPAGRRQIEPGGIAAHLEQHQRPAPEPGGLLGDPKRVFEPSAPHAQREDRRNRSGQNGSRARRIRESRPRERPRRFRSTAPGRPRRARRRLRMQAPGAKAGRARRRAWRTHGSRSAPASGRPPPRGRDGTRRSRAGRPRKRRRRPAPFGAVPCPGTCRRRRVQPLGQASFDLRDLSAQGKTASCATADGFAMAVCPAVYVHVMFLWIPEPRERVKRGEREFIPRHSTPAPPLPPRKASKAGR